MKYLTIFALLCFFPSVFAESVESEQKYFQIGISGVNSQQGNRYILFGEANFIVDQYIGVSLGAGSDEFKGKNNFVDSSTKNIGLGLFIRKYDLGKIQLNYRRGEFTTDSIFGKYKNGSNQYSLNVGYYFKKLDVLLSRSMLEIREGDSQRQFVSFESRKKTNHSTIGGAYYLIDNLRVSVFIGGMASSKTNSMAITYQPKIFRNIIGIIAAYQDSPNSESYRLAIEYYFNSKASLIDRIRKY